MTPTPVLYKRIYYITMAIHFLSRHRMVVYLQCETYRLYEPAVVHIISFQFSVNHFVNIKKNTRAPAKEIKTTHVAHPSIMSMTLNKYLVQAILNTSFTIYGYFVCTYEWMNDCRLGQDSALLRLYWAGNNLGEWDKFCYKSCLWHRIDRSTCWPAVQRATTLPRIPPYFT